MTLIYKILVPAILAFGLTGCNILPVRSEIADLELVKVVGIDKCEVHSDNNVTMTVASIKQQTGVSGGGGGEGQSKSIVLTGEALTLTDAMRKLQTHYNKIIFLGHADYFLLGEEAIKDDFYKYYDFLERTYEIRLNAKVFITKGCSANDILSQGSKGELPISERLDNLSNEGFINSHLIKEMSVIQLEKHLDNPYSAVAIPALSKADNEFDLIEQEKKLQTDVEVYGYAIVKDFKLVGYIDWELANGYNFIKNQADYTVFNVTDPSGLYVALIVENAKTKIKPKFYGDTLESVDIEIKVKSSINEQQSRLDITKEQITEEMAAKQSEIIKQEITNVIKTAQEMNADFLGISDVVKRKNPLKWNSIKDNWDEIFPLIKFNVEVDSLIYHTFDVRYPSGYKEEKQN
ncbi:MAG: Spore germination protein B3 precursor [Firmicutes bacterium ADurb.Bin193]|nr:MAG: Spore germination protein B3 precursor [Firmicutes bacterium ADurb.Bin193]